jgi:S1-C subfamily serine protease
MAVAAAWWATQSLEVEMAPPPSKASAAASPIATGMSVATDDVAGSTTLVAATTSMAGLAGRSATVGLLVTWVDPGNALARAGVRAGDHLLAVNGIDITSMGDLVAALKLVAHKDAVPLYVARGSRNLVLTADLDG